MISVIFDMDGTLLDTQRICIDAWEWAGRNQSIIGVGNDIKNVCGMNKAGWSAYLSEHYADMDVDRFNAEMRQFIVSNQVVQFKTGGRELLNFLKTKGVKIGLASGSSRQSVNHHLDEVGASGYFDVTVSGDEIANGKPAPDIFLRAAELMGESPCDCIVLEDSSNGVRSAIAAGMRCIGIPDVAPFEPEVEELLLERLGDMNEAIEVIARLIDCK